MGDVLLGYLVDILYEDEIPSIYTYSNCDKFVTFEEFETLRDR
jgi:hypothetical protein